MDLTGAIAGSGVTLTGSYGSFVSTKIVRMGGYSDYRRG